MYKPAVSVSPHPSVHDLQCSTVPNSFWCRHHQTSDPLQIQGAGKHQGRRDTGVTLSQLLLCCWARSPHSPSLVLTFALTLIAVLGRSDTACPASCLRRPSNIPICADEVSRIRRQTKLPKGNIGEKETTSFSYPPASPRRWLLRTTTATAMTSMSDADVLQSEVAQTSIHTPLVSEARYVACNSSLA